MIVQETRDLRLQDARAVCLAERRVLEESALDVSGQVIPFAYQYGAETFQDSALHFHQSVGLIWQGLRLCWGSAVLVPTVERIGHACRWRHSSLPFPCCVIAHGRSTRRTAGSLHLASTNLAM